MSTVQRMSLLALGQLVRGAGKLVGSEMIGEGAAGLVVVLANRRLRIYPAIVQVIVTR